MGYTDIEWDDEKTRRSLINFLCDDYTRYVLSKELIGKFIEYLRKYKPIDLSDYDKQHVDNICGSLDALAAEFPKSPIVREAYEGEKQWLITRLASIPYWHKIKAGEHLPCESYIYKFAFESERNILGGTNKGFLIPNIACEVGLDTWYLPVDEIKNLPKE